MSPWEPLRDEQYLTKAHWQDLLDQAQEIAVQGTGLKLSALNLERTEVIGVCNFNNVVHGVFQACQLGYSVGAKYQGQGYMTEILTASLSYVFDTLGLHRVMANYMPRNKRSGALLERLGFEREGLAKSYLKIAGQWEDHILTSKINLGHE